MGHQSSADLDQALLIHLHLFMRLASAVSWVSWAWWTWNSLPPLVSGRWQAIGWDNESGGSDTIPFPDPGPWMGLCFLLFSRLGGCVCMVALGFQEHKASWKIWKRYGAVTAATQRPSGETWLERSFQYFNSLLREKSKYLKGLQHFDEFKFWASKLSDWKL